MRTMPFTRDRQGDDDDVGGAVGRDPWEDRPAPGLSSRSGRRRVPHLMLGILLVLGGGVGSLAAVTQFDGSRSVLVAARPVAVGQPLTALDVREVTIPADAEVRAVDASRGPELLGTPVAITLPAGAMFTPESFADAGVPPPGQAIVALALDWGRLPPEVGPGDRVSIVASPDSAGGVPARTPRAWSAVASSVLPSDTGGVTVVSLQLGEVAAREVAASAADQLSLVALGG
jgi:hypothetical protein